MLCTVGNRKLVVGEWEMEMEQGGDVVLTYLLEKVKAELVGLRGE